MNEGLSNNDVLNIEPDLFTHYGVYLDENPSVADDFNTWVQELEAKNPDIEADFDEREQEVDEAELERSVLDRPDEPQTAWADSESNGTVTEAAYRQQCYWVIGQFGHAMDVVRKNITTDAQAEEWLEMKKTVAAAKSVGDPYELASIRRNMIPVWDDYVARMNVDWNEFDQVCNN